VSLPIRELAARTTRAVPLEVSWTVDEPYGPYGIRDWQVAVHRVLYCVTPNEDVIGYFTRNGYDLLISHHPFVVGKVPQLVLHTALDCCEGGLNDMWRDALGLQRAEHIDGTLGWYGSVGAITPQELSRRVEDFCDLIEGEFWFDPRRVAAGINSVAVCSGLGGVIVDRTLSTGADAYVTGELIQAPWKTGFACVIETGHTRSEIHGVRLLRQILPEVIVDVAPEGVDAYRGETWRRNRLSREA